MFQLNEEQKMFQQSIRQFAKDVVEPRAADIDAKGEFPWDMVEKLKENGFMGLPFAEEYGGEGADLLTLCVAIEELAKVCVNTSLIIGCQELGSTPIKLGGN
ncbi:MAG TPA: acyl-CoA dehydrogenase family protein, partial [Candidatus Limnocylindrales bacterium]